MDFLFHYITAFLDMIFYGVIVPLFAMIAGLLEVVILKPMQLAQLHPVVQVVCVALFTACLSFFVRKLLKAEQKERAFTETFEEKKRQQENLVLITDWKSRDRLTRAMDEDLDEDFNTYLAGRFVRYGAAYLLPLFLILHWLDVSAGLNGLIKIPENGWNIQVIPVMALFLVSYCTFLVVFFFLQRKIWPRLRRKKPCSISSSNV